MNDAEIGPRLVLGPMLRYCDESSATIWVETDQPAAVEVLGRCTTTFSVGGRHYALVMIEGLQPGGCVEYSVALDGRLVWPDRSLDLPSSVIRTPTRGRPVSLLLGSCRAAAPHEPPFSLERVLDHEGRGIDSLWAHGLLMRNRPIDQWPDLLVFLGDQVYADDSSPQAKERIAAVRSDENDLPTGIVANFEEYCWLYAESWSQPVERWLLSTVPSVMIFDDHDMVDDWNISAAWVADIRAEPWWPEHVIGGLMSYWIYQHLGNLSPDRIRAEGLLDRLLAVDDSTELLRSWALESEEFTPLPGGYRFSFFRSVGDVTVAMIDCRNSRVLEPQRRLMVDSDEWSWISEQARATTGHLVLATSLPVFIADGLHDLQVWNEAVCDGAWGRRAARWGERLRRSLDLEDWSAFGASYCAFVDLIEQLSADGGGPRSIVVASGDIHFSYAARITLSGPESGAPVWQVVSSPMRNALIPPERGVMRLSMSRYGRWLAGLLRLAARAPDTRPGIELAAGPFFANNVTEIRYDGARIELVIENFHPDDDGAPELHELSRLDLSRSTIGPDRQPA
jgi:hypothetical protein